MRDPIILFFCLLAAALALLIWRLCRLARDLRREREENRRLRGLLQAGSRLAQADLEQLRKLRHDLRHYLLFAQNAPLQEDSSSTIREALDWVPAADGESWAISALERYYQSQAERMGFQADLRLSFSPAWEAAIPDLCLMLGNLLENSLEALQREGTGWLRVRSFSTPGYLSLVVGNSCTRPLRTVNGRSLSSKAPGRFGIGLETVREIAQRYGGQAEFAVEEGEFRASIFLLRSDPVRLEAASHAKSAALSSLQS